MLYRCLVCIGKYNETQGWRSGLWVARKVEVVGSSPIKGPRCFVEQETLPLLLSTGWFQERIRACYHNRTKINYGRFT
mgnify:CR=1